MNGKQAKRLRRMAREFGSCAIKYENRGGTVRLDAQCDRGTYQILKRLYKRKSKFRNWRVAA